MKLQELKDILNLPHMQGRVLDKEVSILLSDPSLGPRAMTSVAAVYSGSDWESGHFIISPKDNIVSLKQNEALWNAASNLIHSLSLDVRRYKGTEKPTELAKRAQRIIELSRSKT